MTSTRSDTSPEIERALYEGLREMPAWRKLELVVQLNRTARELALSGLRQRHPRATPDELHRRLADLLLGPDLAERAYGALMARGTGDAA